MIKGIAKNLLKRCGYEILGYPSAYATRRSLAGLIGQEQINLVLDVGANLGQFARELRSAGYRGRIVSFEPISSLNTQLRSVANDDPNWTIAEPTAIGAESGMIEINIAGNTESSSILAMLPSHSEAAPQSKYVRTESVPIHRLDEVCNLSPSDRVMLKIDVQGYERQVLAGAEEVLKLCRAVISELSLVPLYRGQALAREIWDFLEMQGFEPWSMEPCFRNPESGRTLQLDGAFVRRKELYSTRGF
jgi:FkbM family methyltransferase